MNDQIGNPIDIVAQERGTYYLLTVSGNLSGKNVMELRREVEHALAIGHTRIGVELSQVTFMDSLGLGIQINIWKRITALSGFFAVLNPSNTVQNVLELSGKIKIFNIFHETPDRFDRIFDK